MPKSTPKKPAVTAKPLRRLAKANDALKPKVTKLSTVIALLRRPTGATVANLAEATGWQQHTVRSVLSRTLLKGHGCKVTSRKQKDGPRVYRIAGRR